ncbi:hypothetical protein B0O99DRAFT_718113 [Bisporella sp. PMI_857]|nr:hypothetical protein B0O99DRAFT_718113 [Bisporella sp. PMI_857]
MKFASSLLVAAAALISTVSARINITNTVVSGITAGTPYTITWGDATGPVTITLKHGLDANNLEDYEVLVTGGTFPSGSYTWTPPATLPSDNYAFRIQDGTDVDNYSAMFQFFGADSSSTSSSGTVSRTSTSSATSSPSTSATDSTTTPTATPTSSNSTTTSRTSSRTGTSTSSSGSSQTSTPATNPGGAASGIAAPLGMVVLAFAALLTLN